MRVSVNLEREEATITIIKKIRLFNNPARRFIIECDEAGFSAVEKRGDGYYKVNYLRERNVLGEWIAGSEKPIESRKITEKEAEELIRKTLYSMYK
jgi:hypothetical protein